MEKRTRRCMREQGLIKSDVLPKGLAPRSAMSLLSVSAVTHLKCVY